ncbi:MAG: polysaccharide deacetylase [Lachnospiraceae bacterium]|nr:polysaccharide deacetylase [Lachnospiraceae bacterium]
MAQTDAGQNEQLAKYKRVRRLKRLIIFVPFSAILFLIVMCFFLGIRLHIVKKELREALARLEATSVIDQTAAENEPGADTEAPLYTVSEVEESGRKNVEIGTPQAEEDNIRKVYLTFDDGPSSNTSRILDILADYNVKATFFVVGKEEEEYQALYKRIVEEGHTLAMHSYSHRYNEIYQSVESYSADLSKLQEFLYDITGVWCRYCRFPGGSSNTVSRVDMHELIMYLDEQDISYFDWNVSSGDASSAYISPENIIRNCTAELQAYDEAIILMHDAYEKKSTVEALPGLIEAIQAMEGTKIVPITDDTEPIHHISND